jgi:hypothetical protein
MDWFSLFGDALGGFGQLFGSQPSTTSRTQIRPPSADELTTQGFTLDQLFNAPPNPMLAYGVGGPSDLLEGGMRASPEQLGYLEDIRRNTIDTGTREINDWLGTARRQNLNDMLARGMDQSSVELWGQDQSTKAALDRVADLISGAGTQYARSAVELPYQTAGVYDRLSTLGQTEGNQAIQRLQEMLRILQAPRMAEVSQTSTTEPGSADRAGGLADLIGLIGPALALAA